MLHGFRFVYTKFYEYCIVIFLAEDLLCYVLWEWDLSCMQRQLV